MDIKSFDRDVIIFREGDPGDCMYSVEFGKVGIFSDYFSDNEKLIAELYPGQLFGEMGLLDHAPRSATAVALENGTVLSTISEQAFYEFFEKRPDMILEMMKQMCDRLRKTTKDYMEVCRTVYETAEAEKTGTKKSGQLQDRIRKFCELYRGFNFYAHS